MVISFQAKAISYWGEINMVTNDVVESSGQEVSYTANSLSKDEIVDLLIKADDETLALIEHLLAGSILLP